MVKEEKVRFVRGLEKPRHSVCHRGVRALACWTVTVSAVVCRTLALKWVRGTNVPKPMGQSKQVMHYEHSAWCWRADRQKKRSILFLQ